PDPRPFKEQATAATIPQILHYAIAFFTADGHGLTRIQNPIAPGISRRKDAEKSPAENEDYKMAPKSLNRSKRSKQRTQSEPESPEHQPMAKQPVSRRAAEPQRKNSTTDGTDGHGLTLIQSPIAPGISSRKGAKTRRRIL